MAMINSPKSQPSCCSNCYPYKKCCPNCYPHKNATRTANLKKMLPESLPSLKILPELLSQNATKLLHSQKSAIGWRLRWTLSKGEDWSSDRFFEKTLYTFLDCGNLGPFWEETVDTSHVVTKPLRYSVIYDTADKTNQCHSRPEGNET